MIETPDRDSELFSDFNAAYLAELHERFLRDPQSVDPATRRYFEQEAGTAPVAERVGEGDAIAAHRLAERTAPAPGSAAAASPEVVPEHVAAAVALATAIRAYGHRAARLDPLGGEPPGDYALRSETYGIREEDLAGVPAAVIGGPLAEGTGSALAVIRKLRKVYQRTSGYEFEHVSNARERMWLRAAVETRRFRPPQDPINERKLLERLTQVGALEHFLHRSFPGQTRFSLEGLGMMVPMLDEIIGAAAEAGTRCVFLGMAHRGRLNVLAHNLEKPYEQIIGEFMGRHGPDDSHATHGADEGWTGDVKYHLGARKAYRGGAEVEMQVVLVPNPSHLEWVNPVVEGMSRAYDERRDLSGRAQQDEVASMPVLIHGDASFPGQGVVAESLNLSRLPGYRVGGTIHIIANNQLGFTAPPEATRSTLYASDLAKGFEIPVIHVNADDAEACIAAARLAHAYRERFRKDVLIDLVGYRRWGHNEGDEPTFTQPRLYEQIRTHPTVRERWVRELERRGLIRSGEAEQMLQRAVEALHGIRQKLAQEKADSAVNGTSGLEAGGATGGLGNPGPARTVETALDAGRLSEFNEDLHRTPTDFRLNPKLERPFERRRRVFAAAADDEVGNIEWGHAEALAFASILAEGTPIRLTGQDSERGTFSQRHSVLRDFETGRAHIPLQSMRAARASFEIWNSPLSEQATLGFEFGYSVQAPDVLVLWEAQYGDFVNVPQVIIDQFVVSARQKWDQSSGMVLLLPHGYEGQGPEHSSARQERFLKLAAENNIRIANCTTSAQYFHILRRQALLLQRDPRPLILFTPKSLLRNPLAASPATALATGRFLPVLEDDLPPPDPQSVRRLILCNGKVYFDLLSARVSLAEADAEDAEDDANGALPGQNSHVTAVRVEELYPFPADELARIVRQHINLREVVWLQEEPRNMGAWTYVAPRLRDLLRDTVPEGLPLRYIGRTRRASPAEGAHGWHVVEQKRLIRAALQVGDVPVEPSLAWEVEHAG
jgi:2-oxoglutarate dehydrogenase E1 component